MSYLNLEMDGEPWALMIGGAVVITADRKLVNVLMDAGLINGVLSPAQIPALPANIITSGEIDPLRIPEGAVTRHQGALGIEGEQIISQLPDPVVAQTNVTQHQAALSIDWSQLQNVPDEGDTWGWDPLVSLTFDEIGSVDLQGIDTSYRYFYLRLYSPVGGGAIMTMRLNNDNGANAYGYQSITRQIGGTALEFLNENAPSIALPSLQAGSFLEVWLGKPAANQNGYVNVAYGRTPDQLISYVARWNNVSQLIDRITINNAARAGGFIHLFGLRAEL